MTQWFDAASIEQVEEDAVIGVVVNGTPIALFRSGENVYALYDQCSHGMVRLSEGYVEDCTVECPLHQGVVDFRTGKPCAAPISVPVLSFPTRVQDGRVEVAL